MDDFSSDFSTEIFSSEDDELFKPPQLTKSKNARRPELRSATKKKKTNLHYQCRSPKDSSSTKQKDASKKNQTDQQNRAIKRKKLSERSPSYEKATQNNRWIKKRRQNKVISHCRDQGKGQSSSWMQKSSMKKHGSNETDESDFDNTFFTFNSPIGRVNGQYIPTSEDESELAHGKAPISSPPTTHPPRPQQITVHSPPEAVIKKRGRKKKAVVNGSFMTKYVQQPQRKLPVADLLNPYEGSEEPLDPYQRKMRDSLILDRYIGMEDRSYDAFVRRPVHRPFLMRNLYYMRYQNPPKCNYSAIASNIAALNLDHEKSTKTARTRGGQRAINSRMSESRTSSRISNSKLPATIKPAYIRNDLIFGQKSAKVQFFHVPEINGKIGMMKRIPSATFEMKVNQHIRNISIDMPDDLFVGVLDGVKSKSEHLVVRVQFQFEDTEVGGKHLRKRLPSEMSENHHSLRKNGPSETREDVLFGSKRLFAFTPGADLKVIKDESSSIPLFSIKQLDVNDLDTKSSAGQLSKLINIGAKRSIDCPFMTIEAHSYDDSDDDEGQEDDDDMDDGTNCAASKRKRRKICVEEEDWNENGKAPSKNGLSLGEALEVLDRSENCKGDAGVSTASLLKLPKRIALKFWLRPPGASLFQQQQQQSSTTNHSPPGQQKRRSFFRFSSTSMSTSTSFEEQHQSSSSSLRDIFDLDTCEGQHDINKGDSSSPVQQPQFLIRIFPTTHCFFCLTLLRVQNMWTLLKHLTCCHPRFDFCYEENIRIDTISLPGISITQNAKYDSSFELRQIRNDELFGRAAELLKRHRKLTGFRPSWLVTKTLAKKVRTIADFPIDRYTTIGNWMSTGEEYIRSMGRFNFETPTRIDQPWMEQLCSRKLNDITDLHYAESALMQIWTHFLHRVRITLFGSRMLYKALRIFVRHYRAVIADNHLRTHFLLHLTYLLDKKVLDEEERYDLLMRIDPNYDPIMDNRHYVGRELALLELEHRSVDHQQKQKSPQYNNTKGDQTERMKTRQHHNNQSDPHCSSCSPLKASSSSSTLSTATTVQQQHQTSSLSLSSLRFNSLQALRQRYPTVAKKRIKMLWKFLKEYDYPNISRMEEPTTSSLTQSSHAML